VSEELGKIEKPTVESYKQGRKLFFVPLIYLSEDLPLEYLEIFHRYWDQVKKQLDELTSKLGDVHRVYHELVAVPGEEGSKTVKDLNESTYNITLACLEKKAQFEGVEDYDTLTEFMDWNRCLLLGLQNPGVVAKVYESYLEAAKKRNKCIARKIDESLKSDEIGIIFMREGHQVQFPANIQVFYVAPPALDEIKRWLREHQKEGDRGLRAEAGREGQNKEGDSGGSGKS
jgi:hypothetical protein